MPKAIRLAVVIPIVAGLGWAAAAAVNVIRADDLVRDASTEMGAWTAARMAPSSQTVASVREKLVEALSIRPDDPAANELIGMLASLDREGARTDQDLGYLVRSLEQRPVSPYTWGNLLEARYLRGEPVSQLELPLLHAVQLGPSEPGVQRIVADYGLALWPELQAQTQALVDRTIASGMRRNPLEMLRISDRRGRLEAACRHVVVSPRPDPRSSRYCEQWEITP